MLLVVEVVAFCSGVIQQVNDNLKRQLQILQHYTSV
jgi:hypothetical protein